MQWARPVPSLSRKKPSGVRCPLDEGAVALVDIRCDEPSAFRIRPGDDQGRHAADVGGQARRGEVALMRRGRDQDLAAEMPAFLLRGELILEMHPRRARLDIGLHDLEGVERAAKIRLRIRDDRGEPVALRPALGMLDLVGPLQGAVDSAAELGAGIGRIEALIGIHRPGIVRVRGDLPAGEIDRLETRPDHLHRLVARDGSERVDIGLVLHRLPQPVGAALGQGVGGADRTTQPADIRRAVGAFHLVKTTDRCLGHESLEAIHEP